MEAHELITPTTRGEWDSFHRIRREVLFEAHGRFGLYDPHHPDDMVFMTTQLDSTVRWLTGRCT